MMKVGDRVCLRHVREEKGTVVRGSVMTPAGSVTCVQFDSEPVEQVLLTDDLVRAER